jgi:hypothetical protein
MEVHVFTPMSASSIPHLIAARYPRQLSDLKIKFMALKWSAGDGPSLGHGQRMTQCPRAGDGGFAWRAGAHERAPTT